jgi:hypothetical protein
VKGQIAVVLTVVALFAGAGIGYFGGTAFQTTVTKTYTLPQESGLETCTVTRYVMWSIESLRNGTTVGETGTATNIAKTFLTTGYPSSTTSTYTGTTTGALASWNVTNCNIGPQTSTSESNTYLTSCTITGVGGFEFRVVSDSTGAPVTGETIKAIGRLGCGDQEQVVYIDNFSESQGGGGWLVPDFPSQAIPAGGLSFTITYQGETYYFTAYVAPVGTNCATFHIPSGNMTTTLVANGSGSYCS